MRNRAKCKLCGDILESFHAHDFVTCKCGEISIDGGQSHFSASAKNFINFLRVDDNDIEIPVTFLSQEGTEETAPPKEKEQSIPQESDIPAFPLDSKDALIKIVDEMISDIERLPQKALESPLNQYDLMRILLLFKKFTDTDFKK